MRRLEDIDLSSFDFLDFGASHGGSIRFSQKLFGAGEGLGIDIDPAKVADMESAGFDCLQADITRLDIPDDSVRFVVISHLLEHLPSLAMVEETLRSAARCASDFIFIQGPFYDEDEYLEDLGLKLYWADWHGHTCHLTTGQLEAIYEELGLENYVVMACDRIESSDHSAVHPLASPIDQHGYDPEIHPPKPSLAFERTVYREIISLVQLRPLQSWSSMVQSVRTVKGAEILSRSEASNGSRPRSLADAEKRRLLRNRGDRRLSELAKAMMLERNWSYLHHLHLRQALLEVEGEVRSVVSTNRNRGLGELALAIELPRLEFHFVPPHDCVASRYDGTRRLAENWGLENFHLHDPGSYPEEVPDVVAAGILGHSLGEEDEIKGWVDRARKFVWIMAGFDPHPNDPGKRRGYGLNELAKLLPALVEARGALWLDEGIALRERLQSLSDEELGAQVAELEQQAERDLLPELPVKGAALAFTALAEKP